MNRRSWVVPHDDPGTAPELAEPVEGIAGGPRVPEPEHLLPAYRTDIPDLTVPQLDVHHDAVGYQRLERRVVRFSGDSRFTGIGPRHRPCSLCQSSPPARHLVRRAAGNHAAHAAPGRSFSDRKKTPTVRQCAIPDNSGVSDARATLP